MFSVLNSKSFRADDSMYSTVYARLHMRGLYSTSIYDVYSCTMFVVWVPH